MRLISIDKRVLVGIAQRRGAMNAQFVGLKTFKRIALVVDKKGQDFKLKNNTRNVENNMGVRKGINIFLNKSLLPK